MNAPARQPWPKAILFDLDDTLWPIEPVIARAEQRLYAWLREHAPGVAQRHTIDTLRDARMALLEQQPHFHLNLADLRRAGLAAAFAEAGEDRAKLDHAMAEFIAGRNAVEPYGDVLAGLERLRGRVLVGTVSNGTADLEAIGLSHHFKVSVAAHQLGCMKPDAAIFHAACRELGVDPADAVYVGNDVLLDVQGAQRAGMRAVWLNRIGSQAHLEHEVVPDAIVANFDELLDWLERAHD